ncbi:hypothetical protein D1007_20351 [Hordeum vulgare]|nr:hypothetical protein D1007_20351 [Hordeum vulgare]
MGWWSTDSKGKGAHDHEARSSYGRRCSSPPRRRALVAFSIALPGAPALSRQYNWHLSVDKVSIPPVPTRGRACRDEIPCRRRRLLDDFYYDPRYAVYSPLWDTWFRDEHDVRHASYFVGEHDSQRRARAERRTRPPSPSEWLGLEDTLALSTAGDVAIPEEQPVAVKEEVQPVVAFPTELVGQLWTWSRTATKMSQGVVVPWCPTPPRSPEGEPSPRGEVVQAPPTLPTFQGPPTHLWTMPSYVDLSDDDDDNGGA